MSLNYRHQLAMSSSRRRRRDTRLPFPRLRQQVLTNLDVGISRIHRDLVGEAWEVADPHWPRRVRDQKAIPPLRRHVERSKKDVSDHGDRYRQESAQDSG